MLKTKFKTQILPKHRVAKTSHELLINLLQTYVKHAQLTPIEFIEQRIASNQISESVGSMFINLCRHKIFLGHAFEVFCEYLESCNKVKANQKMSRNEIIVTLYLVIFELTTENWSSIYSNFMADPSTLCSVLKFLALEETMLRMIEEGCKIYDKEYLLDTILRRLLQNDNNLQTMATTSANDAEKIRLSNEWKPTQSRGPSMMNRLKKTTIEGQLMESTPIWFESTPVPETTYKPYDAEKYLQKEWSKNRKMAHALLAEAKKLNWKCAEPKQPPKPPSPVTFQRIVPKAIPKFTPVTVKTTTASLLRQAALFTKEKEAEIKQIENLMSGTMADVNNNSFLEEIRKSKEEELLQDIERKHLQGLLTREEAILAKQRQQQQNQAKKQQYQEERVKLLDTIDKFRKEEEEKNRQVIEKVQAIESSAKDAEAKLLKERRCNAKLIDYETQVLLKRMHEEREEELNKKMQLIKELKLLQQINARNNKVEFDPTETKNLGLLEEMSIAELQERLALLKVTMKEELEERKAKIIAEKKKQQAMLDDMKHFVETAKTQKCKPTPEKKQTKLIKKPVPDDIKQLREKLKLAREQRLNTSNSVTSIL